MSVSVNRREDGRVSLVGGKPGWGWQGKPGWGVSLAGVGRVSLAGARLAGVGRVSLAGLMLLGRCTRVGGRRR